MHFWITLFTYSAVFCVIYGQLGPCEIALNGGRECKSIFKCQTLLSIVNKTNKTLQENNLLKRSHCGIDPSDDAPAVCCPEDNGQQECNTPKGQIGQCISLYSCPSLTNLLKPPVSNDKVDFVQKSKCKGTSQYSVCCGPVPNFDTVMTGKCALSAFPPDPRSNCCGVDSRYQNKIVGGNDTRIDQYPWLAIIEYVRNTTVLAYVSGALISGLYVLTIATPNFIGKPQNVILGEYDTSNEGPDCVEVEGGGMDCTDGAIRIRIEKTIPHPQYDAAQFIHNIALIRMTRMAPYTDFIRPICLPNMDVTERTDIFRLIAAGWGITSTEPLDINIKTHTELPYVNRDECQNAYNSFVKINKELLCAGGVKGEDACSGYSTLMYKQGLTYEYVGIVNFRARRCGQKGIPTVFTNVYAYDSWIRSNIVA